MHLSGIESGHPLRYVFPDTTDRTDREAYLGFDAKGSLEAVLIHSRLMECL